MIRAWLRRAWRRGRRSREWTDPVSESDVGRDEGLSNSRAYSGGANRADGDVGTTTGTGANELFVGRAAGQDLGYEGHTGAEARADEWDETR